MNIILKMEQQLYTLRKDCETGGVLKFRVLVITANTGGNPRLKKSASVPCAINEYQIISLEPGQFSLCLGWLDIPNCIACKTPRDIDHSLRSARFSLEHTMN